MSVLWMALVAALAVEKPLSCVCEHRTADDG